MRVEAIVKNGGLFIPNPGVHIGKQKHILLDITEVNTGDQTEDSFMEAAGLLKNSSIEGVAFQRKLRKEWDER